MELLTRHKKVKLNLELIGVQRAAFLNLVRRVGSPFILRLRSDGVHLNPAKWFKVFVGGALLGTSEILPLGWLGALAGLIVCVTVCTAAKSSKERAWLVAVFTFSTFAVGSHWLYFGLLRGGAQSPIIAMTFLLMFCVVYACLQSAVIYTLEVALHNFAHLDIGSSTVRWVVLPSGFYLAETVRSVGIWAYPLQTVGSTQLENPILVGWYPIFGSSGITLVTLWLASALSILMSRAVKKKMLVSTFLAAIAVISLSLQLMNWTSPIGRQLSILAIHTHFPNQVKWDAAARQQTWQILQQAIKKPNVNVVVTPETFIVDPAQVNDIDTWREVISEAASRDIHLLIGLPFGELDQEGNTRWYNALMQLGPSRGDLYAKKYLVPFGEYLPLVQYLGRIYEDLFRFPLQEFVPGRGDKAQNLFVAGAELASLICYDIAFERDVAQRAITATWLVHVSNDAWFESTAYEIRMTRQARMRALETGRPVVRANNVGQTVLIGANGAIEASVKAGEPGYLLATVQPMQGLTPFVALGLLGRIAMICFLLMTAFFLSRDKSVSHQRKVHAQIT
jgi:apolipoprotein N-acyltransferase